MGILYYGQQLTPTTFGIFLDHRPNRQSTVCGVENRRAIQFGRHR